MAITGCDKEPTADGQPLSHWIALSHDADHDTAQNALEHLEKFPRGTQKAEDRVNEMSGQGFENQNVRAKKLGERTQLLEAHEKRLDDIAFSARLKRAKGNDDVSQEKYDAEIENLRYERDRQLLRLKQSSSN